MADINQVEGFGQQTRLASIESTDIIPWERGGPLAPYPASVEVSTLVAYIKSQVAKGAIISFGSDRTAIASPVIGDVFVDTDDGIIYQFELGGWAAKTDFVTSAELTTAIASLLTETAADARYPLKTATDPYPVYLTQAEAAALFTPIGGDAQGGLRYNLVLTTGTATSGQIRFNNATLASVTALSIHESDRNSTAMTTILDAIAIGTRIQVSLEDNEETYAWFLVSGAVVDNGSDRAIPVTFVSSSGTLAAGEVTINLLQIQGAVSGGYVIEVNGTAQTKRSKLNIVSPSATATDDAAGDRTVLTLSSGSSSSLISSPLIAFGDSVTVGTGATSGNGYASKLAQATGWTLTNNAAGSTEITDVVDLIFAQSLEGGQYIVAFGLNDLSFHQASSNGQSTFSDAIASCCAWLAVPPSQRIKGQAAAITYSGAWSNSANFGGAIAKASNAAGNTASFSFSGECLLIGYTRLASATGAFTISIDGGAATTVTGANAAASRAGRAYAPSLHKITGLADTNHTCVITVSSGTVELIFAAGVNSETYSFGRSNVFLGNIIAMTASSFSTPGAPANIAQMVGIWNGLLKTQANGLEAIGLGVRYCNENARFSPANFAADQQHPNNTGHLEIANAFLNKILKIPDLRNVGIDPFTSATTSVSGFSPSQGVSGSTITITGSNFTGATAVSIGGTAVASFTVNSASQITAVAPSGVFQPGTISVVSPTGTGVSTDKFGRIIFSSEMAAVPPVDLGGHTVNTGGTAPTVNNTNFNTAPSSLQFVSGNVNFNLLTGEFLTGDFEISAWVRPTTIAGDDREILCIRQSAAQADIPIEMQLEVSANGALRFRLANTGASVTNFDISSSAGAITTNTGALISATVVGTAATIKKDGATVATGTVTGARNAVNPTVMIGAIFFGSPFTDRFWIGQIDSVKIAKLS